MRKENEPCAYADLHECVTAANPPQLARVDATTSTGDAEVHPASLQHASSVRSRPRSAASRAAAPMEQPAPTSTTPAAAAQSGSGGIAADAFMEVTPLLGGELFLCEVASAIFLLEGPAPAPGIVAAAATVTVRPPASPVTSMARAAQPAGGPLTPAQRSWAATVGRRPQAPRRDVGGARFRFDVADVMGPSGPLAC